MNWIDSCQTIETYARPYDPQHPVICMDEQPVQLVAEKRQLIPAREGHPQRRGLRNSRELLS